MNFINLAHGAFTATGGYLTVVLMQRGRAFLACLPIAFVVVGRRALLEATLYRRMYGKPHLDQVLFTIGLAFMTVAVLDYVMGSSQVLIQLPEWLRGAPRSARAPRCWAWATIACSSSRCARCSPSVCSGSWRARASSRLRAVVDDAPVAAGLGINVNRIFFHLRLRFRTGGPGGGALGAELLSLDPNFPLKYMILFLIVVSVGGTSSITGPLPAALLLGIADVAGKYYIPSWAPSSSTR